MEKLLLLILAPSDRAALQMLADEAPTEQIARVLSIPEHEVDAHVSSVVRKLGTNSRSEAVRLAARRGLLAEGVFNGAARQNRPQLA
jgi:DNA-binding CsgD family transcriptional regulator